MTTLPRLVVAYGAAPAHELLRIEAARFHEVSPESVVLRHTCPRCGSEAHGRPYLLPTASMRTPGYVSLGRAGELSVVAVTDAGPVGVDFEPEGAADFEGYEAVALHASERALPRESATRSWVRKEALLKAYGLGLAIDPRQVGLSDGGLTAWESQLSPPESDWMRDVPVPGHVAAVAVLPLPGRDVAGLTLDVRQAVT